MRYSTIWLAVPLIAVAACGVEQAERAASNEPSGVAAPGIPADAVVVDPIGDGRVADAGSPDAALRGTSKPTPIFERCMNTGDAAAGVTLGMMNCLGDEIDRQDGRLNATYRAVMEGLDPAGRERLRSLQRTWIRDRDRQCDAAAEEAAGGSLSGVIHNQCILDRTIERSVWLEDYA